MTHEDALLRLTSRLLARRDALRKTLGDDIDCFGRDRRADGVGDQVEAAADSANDEVSSQLVELESEELHEIEHALERIAAGVCGRCEFCGGKIPATRLNTLPYTSSCIGCQRQKEKQRRARMPEPRSAPWARIDERLIEPENNVPCDVGNAEETSSGAGYRPIDYLLA
jgi:DnaK suppressor protein